MNAINPEPIDQIRRRYPNEWLLIQVTSYDDYGLPKEGILLLHTPDKETLHDALEVAFQKGEGEILTCFAGPLVPEGWEVVLFGSDAL